MLQEMVSLAGSLENWRLLCDLEFTIEFLFVEVVDFL